mgnify:FL=1
MKLFASWSGGKDCMLAMFRILKQKHHDITHLVNMCDLDTQQSRSHGLKSNLIKQQAQSIGIEIIQEDTDFKGYETNLKRVINNLKSKGIEGGIFGDIYLQAHRDWIERVCGELDIIPFFPLWKEDTQDLLNEFIETGFQANIVSVRKDKMNKEWLGKKLDQAFLNEISKTDIDPCAENGEYHTFVHDGPIFDHAINIQTDGIRDDDKHWFLNIN